jgi:hypothetical protein
VPLTQRETELRNRARALIEEGRLPAVRVAQYWGGVGGGHDCSLCDKAIGAKDVEFEVETAGGSVFRFHFMCHAAWQFECARAEALRNGEAAD